jgi:hypothetical protein
MHKSFSSIVNFILLISVGLLLSSCEKAPSTELWIGTYTFPTDSPDFPLYMELTIQGGVVSGLAFDGTLEDASVIGTIEENYYSLLLHPVKHGSNRDQDVTYRGQRSGDMIVGEWVHVVGASGPWKAQLTNKSLHEAMEFHRPPCSRASKNDEEVCEHGT